MTFDFAKILQHKREFHQRLAARPIIEKLAMLDALRARALALRPPRPLSEATVPRGTNRPYASHKKKIE
jgi:hypothetical protein